MTTTHPSSTKQDILQHLLKRGHATAQELAEALDISPQAIRRHLRDLEAEALLVHQVTQVGMGRPNYVYQLSPKGRDQFPNSYNEFAVSLLDTLKATVGQEQFRSILRQQWQHKAIEYRQQLGNRSLGDRVATLVALRKTEGYMAECYELEMPAGTTEARFILVEHNCAIANVAESFPSVCGHELEMFATVLPDCTVERTHWIIDGEQRCGYLIQAKSGSQSPIT
ncbi:transcriptional regulator [Neosynechococcus sphagnicola sy1]|uniref:Transcriptional regulator n=1 Tax=Neosynechococcus sphagnicola sy1 TaxID=1497020 RepID=A0A098TIL6_9CYAN|nr:iron-sulfur cluster biosynthesis transcriptional regulator SufR [Neosynechococcus sphagnicola]KGF71871.1 transcriptional regulator [Neosynechococcus sphagnicola sy1]